MAGIEPNILTIDSLGFDLVDCDAAKLPNGSVHVFLYYWQKDGRPDGSGYRPWTVDFPASAVRSQKLLDKAFQRIARDWSEVNEEPLSVAQRRRIMEDYLLNRSDALKKGGIHE